MKLKRLTLLFMVFLFSSSVFASDYIWVGNNVSYSSASAACQGVPNYGYTFTGVEAGASAIHFNCVGTRDPVYEVGLVYGTVVRQGTACPVNTVLSGDGQTCDADEPDSDVGDTMTGECHSWQDDCLNQDYLDENGDLWTNDGVQICDGDTCLNQWTKTDDNYDITDPTTWPDNTALSTDDSTPTGLGAADELSPFDNYDPGAAGEITTESDSSTTTNSDGSGSTTQTDTRLTSEGIKEETTTKVDTDSSGGTTTTTSTKTTSQDGSTSTSSTTEVKDSGGAVISTSTTESIDEKGEQEEDPSKVSGGGSCDNAPSCEGDAILCHIDLLAWERNCGLSDAISQAETEFQSQGMVDLNTMSPGALQSELTDGAPTDLSGEAASVFAASSSLNTTCPSDFTIDVGIGSVTVPVHILCTYAAIVRTLVMLMAGVFASMTLFRYVGAI